MAQSKTGGEVSNVYDIGASVDTNGPSLLKTEADREEAEPMSKYMEVTGYGIAETVGSQSILETEDPEFMQPVENGYVPVTQVRGRKNSKIKPEDMIEPQDQVLLEWSNIQFFVPVKQPPAEATQSKNLLAEDSETLVQSETGLPKPNYIQRGKKHFKQVLQKNSGYVKPCEMVAIMGPSGSGKTSLLNVLSQRTGLSVGSIIEGKVSVNNRDLDAGDFGKIGAFVQQDDVLLSTLTPKELFTFAARMKTNLDEAFIEDRVERILKRLGLQNCKHTIVGGLLLKGLSGGERKRTSIGYELVTEPSLMLMDEPTSGLDSHTSTKIIQLMRTEAYRGCTIVATIHQPSSEIFMMFDRVIFLSDGYTIYNGPPEACGAYFRQFGLKELAHTNPADKMSIIAAQPRTLLQADTEITMLAKECSTQLKSNQLLQINEKEAVSSVLSRRFTLIEETRKVSTCDQIKLIYKRSMTNAFRNPLQLAAIVALGFIQAFILISLYHGTAKTAFDSGAFSSWGEFQAYDRGESIKNWLGLVFLAVSDQFIICGFAMILQVPLTYPIFRRELGSHLYTPTSYYIGTTLANACVNIFYPVLVSTMTFWTYGYPDDDFGGFLKFMAVQATGAMTGLCYGQALGSFVHTEYAALTWLMQSLTVYYLGSGVFVNAGTANWLGTFFCWISPLRYINELAFRRILAGRPEFVQEPILEGLGFTYGTLACALACGAFMIFYLVYGLFMTNYLSKGH